MNPAPDAHAAELLRFAERLADESRAVLAAAAAEVTRVDVKADNSFVTATDRAIEARLRARIADAYPHHGVLGEEFGSHGLDADVVWVLDPVDGTAPFIAGIPVYGTLIGVARGGRPWLGVLDYPATGDRWVGVDGVLAERNRVPVRTRPCPQPAAALATCSNPDFFGPDERPALARVRDQVRYTLYGASSFAYGLLAAGRTDLAVDSGLKPYDVFAPAAVVGGAGGVLTEWSGAPLGLDTHGRVVAAGDPELHQAALGLLGGEGPGVWHDAPAGLPTGETGDRWPPRTCTAS
ncbi:inositol monophosphatase [Streptomyces mobaraensis NBRC 13819 = DSM 40847]|uniref:Inositol monophosphatase n=1 Tax=Streptomyces mobaraensis (strain ATCC 29032 / DSM 40847 / JCM 4168 / NBRC 13819 / NCIMB 11159 / IPCR 16-22) TaxID=1223523 RepID=M3BIM4_STRM1|nr:inositol monophosphatase family protein [Streptomyces mobaraensis]EME99404.1 inositol monophosphatase [Streptomyces mobaraensis NBRC 13819 = DSM 40847]QTT77117.1 inositol monophosphatase [Streptomyces mobaraensis NBRC 13819 = DSM 40847]